MSFYVYFIYVIKFHLQYYTKYTNSRQKMIKIFRNKIRNRMN